MLLRFLKINIEKYKQYKIEFFHSLLLLLIHFIVMPFLWYVLTDGGKISIHTWDFNHLFLLSLLFSFAISFVEFLGFWDVWSWFINYDGRVQFSNYLTKPIHPLIYLFGLNLFFPALIRLLINFVLLVSLIYISHLHITISFLISVLCGVGILLNFLFSAISLIIAFDKNANFILQTIWSFFYMGDLPVTEIKGFVGFFLTFIIPTALVAAYPVKVLETGNPIIPVIMYVFSTLMLFISWDLAIKHFEAVGG